MFALIDCNNFYASCERVFNPKLRHQPVLVLSNNDGCVIARSNEVKALGIKMGEPYFQVKALCISKHVHVFSSNFALYADMSSRVMSIIKSAWPEVEVYSVDEAFLDLKGLPEEAETFLTKLHYQILKWTGIPVSVGIGQTKTLAKLANHVAKKDLKTPVFNITGAEHWLSQKPVDEVWGIGRRWGEKLKRQGIATAEELRQASPHEIKRRFNMVLEQVALELNGQVCLALSAPEPKKSIMSSRSFAKPETEFDPICMALASYCDIASKKLRAQGSVCKTIQVRLRTNHFRDDAKQHHAVQSIRLIHPSSDVRVITKAARQCLKHIYKSGYDYKKVSVYLDEITAKTDKQLDLWSLQPEAWNTASEALMTAYDNINNRYGSATIRAASSAFKKLEGRKRQHTSPRYTTSWFELPSVS